PNVTGNGIGELQRLPQLRALSLHCGGIRNDVAEHLAGIPALREVCLTGCRQIGDPALEQLGTMKSLRTLELGDCVQISDDGIARLTELTGLERLDLSGCERLTVKSLEVIANLTRLESLNLRGWVWLNDPDLECLSTLTRMRELNLDGCRGLSDHGLVYIRPMKELEEIVLANGIWSNLAASLLVEFPELRRVDLHNSRVNDDGIHYLVSLPRLTELNLSGCPGVRDDGARLFATQESLRLLLLPGSVSEDVVRELSAARPLCGVFIRETVETEA
ncbi:MAG: hypothetical protein Q4C47_05665, partial [Planctomycetia bacterium]|nr:hypothetical protein [Planctomycetia bacterium]